MGKESEKKMDICMYNWITLLYPQNECNIVNQLNSNMK